MELEATGELAAEEPSPLEDVEAADLRSEVLTAIKRLGRTHRETVLLYCYVAEVINQRIQNFAL